MTDQSFSESLVRKSERAIQIARLSLENEDPDSAVNRSYYAMFNISRAALLKAGVAEGELPRTHRGISEAFRQHAVLTGKIDPDLASALSRAESLRLMADYTATEIDADAAARLVEQAENYLRTVKRVFDLQQSAGLEAVPPHEVEDNHSHAEQGSATGGVEDEMEEARRRGREEWLKLQKQKLESGAPTLEQRRKKGVEDWLNLRRQQNRPVKDNDLQRRGSGADLEPGERANDSTKGSDDDLDP